MNGSELSITVNGGEFVHNTSDYDIVFGNTTTKSINIVQGTAIYDMQLYMLVRIDQTNELKYMPIYRDDIMTQKNSMMDDVINPLSLKPTSGATGVFNRLVNFGERAKATGDISNAVSITDADAPLFIIRQNHFTTVGSNDSDSNTSSASGDPFITPLLN